jgi:hypothetical protein
LASIEDSLSGKGGISSKTVALRGAQNEWGMKSMTWDEGTGGSTVSFSEL